MSALEHPAGTATEILPVLANWAASQPLRLCVLFGSMATGRTHRRSDMDVAVWPSMPLSLRNELQWAADIESRTGREASIVVVTSATDPVLGFEIVRDGMLAFERSPGLWEGERSRLWHAYNDSAPFRRAARADLRRWCEEVRCGA